MRGTLLRWRRGVDELSDAATVIRALDWVDPERVAGRLRGRGSLTFLDSAMGHPRLGRYSFVAADPFGELVVQDGRVLWNEVAVDREPMAFLRELLLRYRQPDIAGLPPFQSGAAGFFAYEFGGQFERLRRAASPAGGAVPDVALSFYDVVCGFDHVTRRGWLVSTGLPETALERRRDRAQQRAEAFLRLIEGDKAAATGRAPAIPRRAWNSNFTPGAFGQAVERVRQAILDGDIFQANVAQRFMAGLPPDFDGWAFYRRLRVANAAPFAAFVERGALSIASSSPERFLATDGTEVEARPIKGTIGRAADPAADGARAAALAASGKDRAENIMIVDLMRNDLSRVCEPGSVRVPELCALESYAGVHHLVSAVTGRLQPGRTALDLIAAGFPGGSVTGAPKIRAMEIIADIEREARGVYCGSIGFLGFNGRADLNIAIRTAALQNGVATVHAGGAITFLSDPDMEYRETLDKADRILRAFEQDEHAVD